MIIGHEQVNAYLEALVPERQEAMNRLINIIMQHIPPGFELTMQYGMPAFIVPFSRYPQGYHCKKGEPLPFISMAAQKHFLTLYHCGLYALDDVLQWFRSEYPKYSSHKVDMGKGCIRFRYLDDIPYDLLAELMQKISVERWIEVYESTARR